MHVNKKGDRSSVKRTLEEISKSVKKGGSHVDKNFHGGSFTPEERKEFQEGKLSPGVRQVQMINTENDIKEEKAVSDYNENIHDLDELYTSQRPIRKVLVRCFLQETIRSENGLILPPDQIEIQVPTKSGQGYVGTVTSPWAFSKKAVVIATPHSWESMDNPAMIPGDIVQLGKKVLHATKAGEEFNFSMPSAFMHWSFNSDKISEDKTSPHYGYFLIDHFEIDMVDKQVKTNK